MQDFCNQLVDLRSPEERENLLFVKSEAPALWDAISDILNFEKHSRFLPLHASRIVSRVLYMRIEIFVNAPEEHSEDYIEWPDPTAEHETMFYPNWSLIRWPKRFSVR